MSAGEAVELVGTNGKSESPRPLLGEIQARLAEVDESPPQGLVVGLWKPSRDMCVVALAGEMDMTNATELTRMLDGCLGAGPSRLVVEVSRLTFMDSTGLNQLVAVSRPLKARGGETLLAGPTAHVARVFEIVRLDELITVMPSLEDALTRVSVNGAVDAGREGTDASQPKAPRTRPSRAA